jgi:hypothetical protein
MEGKGICRVATWADADDCGPWVETRGYCVAQPTATRQRTRDVGQPDFDSPARNSLARNSLAHHSPALAFLCLETSDLENLVAMGGIEKLTVTARMPYQNR